jgi:hypothetical protein
MIRDSLGIVSKALAAHADWAFRLKADGKWKIARRPRRQKLDAYAVDRLIEESRKRPTT